MTELTAMTELTEVVEMAELADLAELPELPELGDTKFNSFNPGAASRQRKAVVPPAVIPDDMSVLEYLRQCQPPLDKKIIDIACSQSCVPSDLRDDAGQEIALMWSQMKPDHGRFKPGQIASYAHLMARHAALRLRREIGSAVRLPGSAFRKRKDGSSYVTPGVLAQALDWNELESWFQADDQGGEGMPGMGMSLEFENVVQAMEEEGKASVEDDPEEAARVERMEVLEAHRTVLSARQFSIMRALVEGANYEEVMAEHGIKKGVLMREVAVASSLIGPLDF